MPDHIIAQDIIEYINLDRFRELLRQTNLPVSGIKKEITARISEVINGNISEIEHSLTVEKLDHFIADEIAHGKNRMLFVSSFPESSIPYIQDVDKVKAYLDKNHFPQENFNNLRTTSSPDDTTLVYLDMKIIQSIVTKISMCFATPDIISGLTDSEGEPLPPRKETDYIWVDILTEEPKIIIKMRQKSNPFGNSNPRIKELYDEVSTKVRETFSLAPVTMSGIKNTFYVMFKDLTETAEKPFTDKVNPFKEEISIIARDLATKIGLENLDHPLDLPHRLVRLLERALIQQDFDSYEKYFAGKRGIVNRIYYSDATGASINARSSEREEGIAVADIYFDTRESIENRKILDKIWVQWFYKENEEKEPRQIETKFEAYKEHYVIHFLYAYTTKEIQDHVLSNFKHYEEIQG